LFAEGNIECVEKLLKPARRVLKVGMPVKHDAFEQRVELWNKIRMNYDSYLDEECDTFLKDLDQHFCSLFDGALLVLAASFRENGEFFGAANIFSDKEVKLFRNIERYNLFEILSADDIRKKLIQKDDKVLELLRDYYVSMDSWVDGQLEDPSLRLTLRYYLKKKWDGYKEKLNLAVSSSVVELDWLKSLIGSWEHETENRVEQVEEKVRMPVAEKTLAEGKGTRYVKLDEVKQYELNFIGRLEYRLGNKVTFSSRTYKVEELREIKQVDTSRFAGVSGLSAQDLKSLPENRSLVGFLTEKKLLGKKQRYNLKALFSARVEKYAEVGFDTDPLELKDLNACLVDSRDEAKEKGERVLLCLASPTGFEASVGKYISSENFHRNFLSKYLSVCLLDLETGKQLYNPHDEVAKEFAKLCELETETEKNEKLKISVRKTIEDSFLLNDFVVLEDIVKSFGNFLFLKSLFYDYADEKSLKIQFVKDVGLVMMQENS